MTAVVTATGGKTFFGRTANLIGAAGAKSHSQKAVAEVGDFLLILAFLLALILVAQPLSDSLASAQHIARQIAEQHAAPGVSSNP